MLCADFGVGVLMSNFDGKLERRERGQRGRRCGQPSVLVHYCADCKPFWIRNCPVRDLRAFVYILTGYKSSSSEEYEVRYAETPTLHLKIDHLIRFNIEGWADDLKKSPTTTCTSIFSIPADMESSRNLSSPTSSEPGEGELI